MKKFLTLVLLVCSATFFAQEPLEEGVIITKQTMSSPNPEVNAQLAMMGDMTTTTYFKGYKSKSEMSNPMSGDITTYIDMSEGIMVLLMDNPMMGKKYIEQSLDLSEEDLENIEVEMKADESKEILGYRCVKYNVTTVKDGVELKMEMYVTDKLNISSQNTATFVKKIKGYPMYMSMSFNQMGMDMVQTSEVTEIRKEPVSDEQVEIKIPEGYEKGN